MVKVSQETLTNDQKEKIEDAFGDFTVVEFLTSPIETEEGLLDGTGFIRSSGHSISASTTYKQYYEAIYNSYDFPKKSLHENECLAFCPDTFASVNGVCWKCKSPCKKKKKEVTRCTKCL